MMRGPKHGREFMYTFVCDSLEVHVPRGIVDLESFRRWADTDDFPENARVWFLKGEVWVETRREPPFTHCAVKTEITAVLAGLVKREQQGRYWGAGVFVSNEAANIAGKPDGTFASREAWLAKRVRPIAGMDGGYVELEGSPDMVLEVVSHPSIRKELRQAYGDAGIREFWLVDVRQNPLRFDILRYTGRNCVAARSRNGWLKSAVFGRSFRLTQEPNVFGQPEYTLEVR
jgi:Uma2 family endonuclease